jgi:MoxR-like ATPase
MLQPDATSRARELVEALSRTIVGQQAAAEALVAGYLAGGHVLLEGVPGVGKTLLARAFAAATSLRFTRLQLTPDLMPADVTGTSVFDAATGTFRLVRGPVFTEVLLADEINRTPPRTQSALLEAMQERQVTLDGVAHPLDPAFLVIATQNPIEFEGTYPLPEAQLDRFLLRVEVVLPGAEAEFEIYRQAADGRLAGWAAALPGPVLTAEAARALRGAARGLHASDDVLRYLARLAAAVRASPHVDLGPSPRGGLALLELARATALLAGREFVTPDDVKRLLVPAWGHRVLLGAEAELEGHTPRSVLEAVAGAVPVPH